jgi:hypothetical protein
MEDIPIPSGNQPDAANADTGEHDDKLLFSYLALMVAMNLSHYLNLSFVLICLSHYWVYKHFFLPSFNIPADLLHHLRHSIL